MLDARSNTSNFRIIRPKKVRFNLFTSRPFFILSAFMLLFNSAAGDLFVGESWAAKVPSGFTSVDPEKTGGPTPTKSLNADTFTLPQELGFIQEYAKLPNSNKTVIHIQDAHCNYPAQKSIREILNYITTEYGIDAVNCEGGKGSYDLTVFTDIGDKEIREKTSDFFVREGVLSAAEYFAVNNPKKVRLWGVEDADLYIKNLRIYRDSLAHKDEADRYIKSIGYILDNLKRRVYSQELLEFDAYYTKYKDNKIGFKEYMIYLMMAAEKRMIDIKAFQDIYMLSQALEQEDKISFKRANNEKDEIVDRLKKVLSRNELGELMTKVGQLKTERIPQADFYSYLVKKAKSIKLDLENYPELRKYIVYISLYNAIDRTKVAKEIDTLEDKIREPLYENDTQRELGVLSKNLVLTKNIFNISLTRDDYAYYMEHRAAFAVVNYVNFIDREAPLYKIKAMLDENITKLDQYREGMEQFYECSLERDKAFIKNIKFTDHDRPNSIIITGGFHTENLRELFRKENVSYISIMPKFRNEPGYESPYLKRLAGQKTALENVIDTAIPAVLNLAVVNILSKLGIIVKGETAIEGFKLAVLIVAAIIAGKDFVLEVKAGLLPGSKPDDAKFVTFTKGEGAEFINYSEVYASEAKSAEKRITVDAKLVSLNPFRFEPLESTPEVRVMQAVPVTVPVQKEGEAMKDSGSQGFGIITNDLRQNMMNIFLMPARVETVAGQSAIGRELAGKFEKKYGINTGIFYFKDTAELKTKLLQAVEMAMLPENEGKFPKILVDCLSRKELAAVKTAIRRMKKDKSMDGKKRIDNMIAIAKDFDKDITLAGLSIPDEVRVIAIGSAIMNDRRLKIDFKMSAQDLFEARKKTIEFLVSNKVIPDQVSGRNIAAITVDESKLLDVLMDDIWRGRLSLRCTRIDWKKLDEFKDAQRKLMESV
ncbi:MAG: hypothetical protein A3I73_06420 [Omnitrophica bacterium RIFCSPLOWO2_02_FULL_45_16]|nr:MAG: hypothetical protein A3I73_06420 [Omnitrophica bacterium RIFCSPLOWO2_02_FULL_45_16]